MLAAIQIGQRFERLTVVERSGSSSSGEARWLCLCDCGNTSTTSASNLRRGNTKSCGCLQREQMAARSRKHGGTGTVEYIAWNAMVQRCTRESHPAYKNYGGRGITVCAQWRHDFSAFLAHIGPRPSRNHSLDRIDNGRGYEPGNVRWATLSTQASNRRQRDRDDFGRYT